MASEWKHRILSVFESSGAEGQFNSAVLWAQQGNHRHIEFTWPPMCVILGVLEGPHVQIHHRVSAYQASWHLKVYHWFSHPLFESLCSTLIANVHGTGTSMHVCAIYMWEQLSKRGGEIAVALGKEAQVRRLLVVSTGQKEGSSEINSPYFTLFTKPWVLSING